MLGAQQSTVRWQYKGLVSFRLSLKRIQNRQFCHLPYCYNFVFSHLLQHLQTYTLNSKEPPGEFFNCKIRSQLSSVQNLSQIPHITLNKIQSFNIAQQPLNDLSLISQYSLNIYLTTTTLSCLMFPHREHTQSLLFVWNVFPQISSGSFIHLFQVTAEIWLYHVSLL